MSRTLRRRALSRRTLRRLKQGDRDRVVIRARTVDTQDERKRIEKLWEQSIDFFTSTNYVEGDTDGKA